MAGQILSAFESALCSTIVPFDGTRSSSLILNRHGRFFRPSTIREVYLDDGGSNNVRVYASISGPLGFGYELERQTAAFVLAFHRHHLGGPSFREFHMATQSWRRNRNAFRDFLIAVLKVVGEVRGRIVLSIDSREALRGSPEYLRPDLGSCLDAIAPFATPDELAAVEAETELLWWIARRARFHGTPPDSLQIIVDEKGTSLKRLKERWTISHEGRALLVSRSEMLGTLAKWLSDLPGVREEAAFPAIRDVRAVDSQQFFCVQACDLLAGLTLGALRAFAGSPRPVDSEKLAMLEDWLDLGMVRARLGPALIWDGSEVQPRDNAKFHTEVVFNPNPA